jgi:hypothetical protein
MVWMLIVPFIKGFIRLIKGREIREIRDAANVPLLNKEPNIGKEDRMIRASIGVIALLLLMVVKRGFILRYLLGLAALIGLVTAYTRYSPVYDLIGEDTRKKGKKRKN